MEKKKAPKTQPKEVNRFIKGEREVYHDLFELEIATTKRNASYREVKNERQMDLGMWQDVKHMHQFHTIDSNGKKMFYSSMIAGHCHPVTVKEVDGELVAECGPPMKKFKGKFYPAEIRGTRLTDKHTHEIKYVDSEMITVRKANKNAAEFIAMDNAELPR